MMSLTPKSSNGSDHPRRPSGSGGGFFHSLKKFALGGAKDVAVDPEFDIARENFLSVFDSAKKVRGAILSYIASLRSLFSASGSVANDIADVLELKTAEPHAYSSFVRDTRKAHTDLVQHKMVAVLSVLETRALKRIDELIAFGNDLQKRTEERQKMKEEFEYYSKKVTELKKDREKHAASRKEDPKEIEKFDRNTKKLEDIRISYTHANANLLVDLRSVWERRAETFGPAGLEFVQGEKDFIHFYSRALEGLGDGMVAPPIANFNETTNAPASAAAGSVSAKTDALIHSYTPVDPAPPAPYSSSSASSAAAASSSSSAFPASTLRVSQDVNEVEIKEGAEQIRRKSSATPGATTSYNGSPRSSPPPPPPQPPQPSPRPSAADVAAITAASLAASSSSTAGSTSSATPPLPRQVSNPFDDVSL